MRDYKELSLLLIPYVTFCSALYHVAYWATFNLNGLAYISLADLIKSAAYPIMTSMLVIGLQFSAGFIMHAIGISEGEKEQQSQAQPAKSTTERKVPKWLRRVINVILAFTAVFVVFGFPIAYESDNSFFYENTFWFIWILVVALIVIQAIQRVVPATSLLGKSIYKGGILQFWVYTPLLCFAAGKMESVRIKRNQQYTYTQDLSINRSLLLADTAQLKLLGNTDKYFVFTDLKNESNFFVRDEQVLAIRFRQKTK